MLEANQHVVGNKPNGNALLIAVITLAGLLLRLAYIGQPMRYDEAYSYLFFVHVPLATTLSDYSVPNQHILNSLLMRLSAALLGDAPWALRLPAFIFGVAVIPATYVVLRKLFNEPAALLAAACVAVSAPLIVYSTNARGYSLVVLLFLCALGLTASDPLRRTRRSWQGLVAVSVIGLYTIPTMLYAIGGVWLWRGAKAWSAWRSAGNRRPLELALTHACATVALTALLYMPVIAGTGFGSLVANDWVVARAPAQFVAELPVMLRDLWLGWHAGMPRVLAGALALGCMYFVLAKRGNTHNSLIATIVLWCVAVLFMTFRPPFPRVFLFLLPLYFGVAAAGLCALAQLARFKAQRSAQWAAVLVVGVWSGTGVVRSDAVRSIEGPVFPDAQAVVAYLASNVKHGDGVYARTPADAPIWYYTWRMGLRDDMLRLKYNAAARFLVVINESEGQTIDQVLAQIALPRSLYYQPVLRYELDRARIYEMRRVPRERTMASDPASEAARARNPDQQSRAPIAAAAASAGA